MVKQNIKVSQLAEEMNMPSGRIWYWFQVNRIPKKYLKMLAERFGVEEEYIGKQVNDISTYKPKVKGFQNEYKINGEITYVYIVNRKNEIYTFLIDTEDLPKLIEFDASWFLSWSKSSKKNYISAMKFDRVDENGKTKYKSYYLERFVTDAPPKTHVDHEDQDPLNNRKYNLRVTSVENNIKHRKSKNSNNSSGFRNVFWDSTDKRWLVTLQVNKKSKCFGRFKLEDLDKAGALAEEMRNKYYGEFKGKN